MNNEKKTLIILTIIVIILGIYLTNEVIIKPTSLEDINDTYRNVTYYGIHEVRCPVCNATGESLIVVGHSEEVDKDTGTINTITIIYCTNCSHEFKIK